MRVRVILWFIVIAFAIAIAITIIQFYPPSPKSPVAAISIGDAEKLWSVRLQSQQSELRLLEIKTKGGKRVATLLLVNPHDTALQYAGKNPLAAGQIRPHYRLLARSKSGWFAQTDSAMFDLGGLDTLTLEIPPRSAAQFEVDGFWQTNSEWRVELRTSQNENIGAKSAHPLSLEFSME